MCFTLLRIFQKANINMEAGVVVRIQHYCEQLDRMDYIQNIA